MADGLFLLPVLMIPLVFSGGNTHSIVIKGTLLQFSVISLLLFLPCLYYTFRTDPSRALPSLPWFPVALLLVLGGYLYFSAYVISGHPRALYEYFRWTTYLLLALVVPFYIVQPGSANRFLLVTVMTSILVSVYASVQMAGFDFYEWPLFAWEEEKRRRVCSSLGNPDFLAGYLIALLPLTLVAAIQKQGWARRFYVLAFVLQCLAMIFSYSRGGWVSTYLSLLILVVAFIYINWGYEPALIHFRLSFRSILAGLGCIFLSGLAALGFWWDKIETALFRLAKFSEGTSIVTRPMFYEGAFHMFWDRPLFGFGLGTFGLHFQDYRPGELATYFSFKDWVVDHVHNEWLEVASETGSIGLLLYLGIFLSVSYVIWKKLLYERSRDNLFLLGVWGALVGIQIHNLFTVTLRHTPTAFMYWSLLGVAIGLCARGSSRPPARRFPLFPLLILAIPFAVPFLFGSATAHYMGDRYIRNGWDRCKPVFELKQALGDKGKAYTPYHLSSENRRELQKAIVSLHRGKELSPYREKAYFWLGLAYNLAFDYPQAIEAYKQLNALHSNFAGTYYNIATTYLKQTDFLTQAQYNQLPNRMASFTYFGSQCVREAIVWLERALESDPNLPLYYRVLGRCYYTLGEMEKAETIFREGLKKAEGREDLETRVSVWDMEDKLKKIEAYREPKSD